MKAWRVYNFNDMRLDEVPVPEPRLGWVLLKVLVVQPSVTELSLFSGFKTIGYNEIKVRLAEAPVQLFGHEFCAEVVRLGPAVANLKPGDRVVARGEGPCHKCLTCRKGMEHFCSERTVLGWTCPGAFAEFLVVPADMLAVIPKNITDAEGAGIQPLSDAAAAVEAAEIKQGDCVVVLGQGVMGLLCLQVAKCLNAGRVIAVDVNPEALKLSSSLGADLLVNAAEEDPVKAVLEATEGLGANVVIDSAGGNPQVGLGGSATIHQAINMTRLMGKTIPLALYNEPVTVDTWQLRDKSLSLVFPPSSSQATLDRCIRWVERGSVRLKPLITHVLDGLDRVSEAFAITRDKRQYRAIGPAQVVVSQAH